MPAAEILILLLLFSRVMPKLMSANRHYQNFLGLLPAFTNVMARGTMRRGGGAAAAARRAAGVAYGGPAGASVVRLSGRSAGDSRSHLAIPAGRVTAIVGPSGVGKSTVADLVMGLITPWRGG